VVALCAFELEENESFVGVVSFQFNITRERVDREKRRRESD